MKYLLLVLPVLLFSDQIDTTKFNQAASAQVKNVEKTVSESFKGFDNTPNPNVEQFKGLDNKNFNVDQFKGLDQRNVNMDKYKPLDKRDSDVDKFKTLDNKNANVDEYKHLDRQDSSIQLNSNEPKVEVFELKKKLLANRKTAIDFLKEATYTVGEYLTKDEFEKLRKNVLAASKDATRPKEFILFFTSTSVPTENMFNVAFSVSVLQSNHFDIDIKQIFIGLPDNLQSYLTDARTKLSHKSDLEQKRLERTIEFKMNPYFFEKLNIKKAPALALARCSSLEPTVETCEIKYLIRGDVSLATFFDKITQEDKSYQKYYDALIANKILTEGR